MMPASYKIVDIKAAKNEDAAEVVITPELVLDVLDAWAPEEGTRSRSFETVGRYEVVSAPADDTHGAPRGGTMPL
jgi:hypothetical protein